MGQLINLKDFDESRFWEQLEKKTGDETAIDRLKASVRDVAEQSNTSAV